MPDDSSSRDRLRSQAEEILRESIRVKENVIATCMPDLVDVVEMLFKCVAGGAKVLLCGNGGSAADAQHLAAEFLIRFRSQVARDGIPALALATDTSSLTACGNDLGFDVYFERMVRALGRDGDVLVAISTSGNSPNVVRALVAAREIGLGTIGFLGNDGGEALRHCDRAIVVPSDNVARIQEAHITCGHIAVQLVEEQLLHAVAGQMGKSS